MMAWHLDRTAHMYIYNVYTERLQWVKIGKVANLVKFSVPSDSEPLWWEKIGKVVIWAKLAILSHSVTLVGKDWKSHKSGEIGSSKSFSATSVGNDWKNCELGEIIHVYIY